MFAAILIVPWLLALLLTPLVIRWATARGWVDHPGGRKMHDRPVAILGGLAVYGAMLGGLLLLAPFLAPVREGAAELALLMTGGGAMLALGLLDDLRDLAPVRKLAAQTAVAVATWAVGFRASGELPLAAEALAWSAPVLSFVITVGWIVVVTNAVNLIDGMDGLASGISVIAMLTIFLLAFDAGATVPVIGTLILAGALAAFLRFNLPPARIFLGDAGSMLIGYLTAVLALASYQKAPTGVALIVPLLVIGLPMLDTALAILRRGIGYLRRRDDEGFHPIRVARAVFSADRGHIHHLLQRTGLGVPQVLAVLYGISGALAALGFYTRGLGQLATWSLWLSLLAVGFALLRLLERRVERIERQRARADALPAPVQQTGQRAAG